MTKIELLNPQEWLYFETTEPDGKVTKHHCEMRSAHVLQRSGWSPELAIRKRSTNAGWPVAR